MTRTRPAFAIAVAASVATLFSTPAHARWMPHFDLTGLVLASERGMTPTVSGVELALPRDGAAPIACGAQMVTATQSTAGASRWTVALRCDRATPGAYAARAVITVDHAGPRRTRDVELGAIRW